MKNFITDLWLGKIPLPKTWWLLVIFISLYFYILHSKILYDGSLGFFIESLGFYIFADILGVALSFFILASVWRSSEKYKTNKLWPILSKISAIGIVAYTIYQGYIKWIIQD